VAKKEVETLAVLQCLKSSYIVIDAERCKGCHLCISACPREIIGLAPHINRMGYNPAAVIEEKAHECTGCAACAMMCPDTAITVYRHSRVPSAVVA